MRRRSTSFEDTLALGEMIGRNVRPGDVVSLEGPLGSGKTSLVKGIARALEIGEEITSPSFTLIGEYHGSIPLYHMDLYRIDSPEEFELLGAEELLYGKGVSVIEWAEKMREYLPRERISLVFELEADGSRTIEIEGIEL